LDLQHLSHQLNLLLQPGPSDLSRPQHQSIRLGLPGLSRLQRHSDRPDLWLQRDPSDQQHLLRPQHQSTRLGLLGLSRPLRHSDRLDPWLLPRPSDPSRLLRLQHQSSRLDRRGLWLQRFQ
jgi:hypothetical protein